MTRSIWLVRSLVTVLAAAFMAVTSAARAPQARAQVIGRLQQPVTLNAPPQTLASAPPAGSAQQPTVTEDPNDFYYYRDHPVHLRRSLTEAVVRFRPDALDRRLQVVQSLAGPRMGRLHQGTVARGRGKQESVPVAAWEQRIRGAYDNKGIAEVERLGSRWVLTIACSGRHTTYLDDTDIDLAGYVGKYVSARYHYVERAIDNPKCVRAPCAALTERRIALERLTIVSATRDEAEAIARRCVDASPPGRSE